jgi:hypothetical protein
VTIGDSDGYRYRDIVEVRAAPLGKAHKLVPSTPDALGLRRQIKLHPPFVLGH